MPGLVNAHAHSPMTLFRGHAEGRSLFTLEGWFNTIRVLESRLEPDVLPAAVAVSCAEMIRTGTTCFADQYFWMDRIALVVAQSGLRAALAYGMVELGDEAARARELRAAANFLASLAGDRLIRSWVGPHAFFVDNSEAAMRQEIAGSAIWDGGCTSTWAPAAKRTATRKNTTAGARWRNWRRWGRSNAPCWPPTA